MPFSLTSNPSLNEISDAINYLLNNFGSNVSIDLQTGIIAGPSGRISNLYKYISIKYATSYDGTVGFSNVPTNATYYGIRNSNSSTESTNPADYIWYKTTGFGTTNFLWYIVAGGRQIDFYLSATQPSDYYVKDPGTAIDIDIVTTTKTVNVAVPVIYKWTSGSAPARPSTTSTYTWSTASYSAPSGWSTTPTTDSTAGDVQWAIYVPITANSNVATSTIDWTNTSYPIVQFSSNGANGSTGGNGLSAITAYKVQLQTASNPTFTTPTSGSSIPTGWYSTVSAALSAVGLSSFTPGYVLWYIFGQYNSTASTISGVSGNTTAWTGPTAASIFQDIQSDNWDGSVPPTYTNSATWGTKGYYLRQGDTTGSPSAIYINNGVFRGDITTNGQASFQGRNTASFTVGIIGVSYTVQYSEVGYALSSPTSSSYVRAGNLGFSQASSCQYNVGAIGIGLTQTGTTNGIGVVGSGDLIGVSAGNSSSTATSLSAIQSNSGIAFAIPQGYMVTNSTALVTNLYSDYAKTMVGTTSNQLRFVSGTSTGSSLATFSGTKPGGSSTNAWMTMQIDATTIYIPVWT
jgi:hypothetical protein